MSAASILFVSTDGDIIKVVRRLVSQMGHEFRAVASLDEATEVQSRRQCDAMLLQVDTLAPGAIDRVAHGGYGPKTNPPVIAVSRARSISGAVDAIRAGASDYLTIHPINAHRFRNALRNALTGELVVPSPSDNGCLVSGFLTADSRLLAMQRLVLCSAETQAPLLIQGEIGTGKTFLARLIHQNSVRSRGPLQEIHCGALSHTLIESELFGHSRGAFTGAERDRTGKFEAADGGTLLLDEIDHAWPRLQEQLLRIVDEGKFERLGETKTRSADVRVVAISNMPLVEAVGAGHFRSDLYHRLSALLIHLPPLRERVVDIPLLARHFLKIFTRKHHRSVEEISPEAMDCLVHYAWPGNVRELRNTIEHAMVMAQDGIIRPANLPGVLAQATREPQPVNRRWQPLRQALRDPERLCIQRALELAGGSKLIAAEELGISRSTLYKKMKEYGLDQEPPATANRSGGRIQNTQAIGIG